METYYTVLEVPPTATAEDIAAAYARQRDRYNLERVAALGDAFRHIAETRLTNLERACTTLSDPQRRRAYDASLGLAPADDGVRIGDRSRLSRRERGMAISGVLAGLLVIALVWGMTGRSAQAGLPPIAETNRPAPDFALPGLHGETVRLSDYKGKVVLVNFWGTWCVPCKEETPALAAVYRKLRDQGLVIIGVDLRNQERPGPDGDADVRAFTEGYGVTYPIALDVAGETARAFQIYPLPTSFVVDQRGAIRYIRAGKITAEEVEMLFTRLQQNAAAQR